MATCPNCLNELDPGDVGGLCPACLLAQAAGDTVAANLTSSAAATAPNVSRALDAPFGTEQLASAFPQLDQFELIGRGGMGVVYKARQKHLDRFVALKILSPQIVSTATFTDRFGREARALAKLNHPNIVAIFDFGQTQLPASPPYGPQTIYYLLMEYVDGANLRSMVKTLSPTQALAIVPQICDALQYAHDAGVVHRDIKPENILLDRRGRVKIADFGLAKLAQQARSTVDFTLTSPEVIMGTPHYMAPEQMEHPTEVDHRADIYSLGVVFYEMLTGQLPLGRFQPPSAKVQVDVRLDEVVLRSLEREPERRYQHASDVRTGLDSVRRLATSESSATQSSARESVPTQPAQSLGARERWTCYANLFAVYCLCWPVFFGMWNLGWTAMLISVACFSGVTWVFVSKILAQRPEIIQARRRESRLKKIYRRAVPPLSLGVGFLTILTAVALANDASQDTESTTLFPGVPALNDTGRRFLKNFQSTNPRLLRSDVRDLELGDAFGSAPNAWTSNGKAHLNPTSLLTPERPTLWQAVQISWRVFIYPSSVPPGLRPLPNFWILWFLGLTSIVAGAADMLACKPYVFSGLTWKPAAKTAVAFVASAIIVNFILGTTASFVRTWRIQQGQVISRSSQHEVLSKPGNHTEDLIAAVDRWAIGHGYVVAAFTSGNLYDARRFPMTRTQVGYQSLLLWKPGMFDRLRIGLEGFYSRAPEILVQSASTDSTSQISITLPVWSWTKTENDTGNALQQDLYQTLKNAIKSNVPASRAATQAAANEK